MKKECRDHLGTQFDSISEMCRFYKLNPKTYRRRLKEGYDLKEFLPINSPYHNLSIITGGPKGIVIDHTGKEFKSQNEMCAYYGIDRRTFQSRLRRGYSLKDALLSNIKARESSMRDLNGGKIVDPEGREFISFKAMCAYHKVNYSVFKSRFRDRGYSLVDALSPTSTIATSSFDHLGNEYSNNREMAQAYNISVKLFEKRYYEYKWSIEEALTLPRNMYIGEYRVAECLKKLNVKFYHDCSIKTIFKVLHVNINWNDFLSELKHNFENAGIRWSKSKIEKLRPDFVLYTDNANKIRGVIEFDGEQHQNFVEYFFKTIEDFYRRSNVDFVKQSLWEYLNIPMLRIRHDQVDRIDDMVKDFIDNPQNYIHNHNTYLSEDEYWSILSEEKAKLDLAFVG